MSALEETLTNAPVKPASASKNKPKESLPTRFLNLLSSVPFGIVTLILLGLLCLVGMLIMQQEVDGFDRYYAALTPAQQLVYGKLGLFDIYHSWYFNVLLLVLSLNIILSSIDRFPKTWTIFSKPNVTVPLRWLREQSQTAELSLENADQETLAARIAEAFKRAGWGKTRVGEKNGRTFVYAESGAWNRLGAYAVHVALLMVFLGGFFTSQLGFNGQMPLTPGQTSNLVMETKFELDQVKQVNKQLPFDITCTDIQQKLIKKDGSLSAANTIDWMTRISITDETGKTHEALVQMNKPYDYRGYRFFQSSFSSTARARNVTLQLTPAGGGGEPQQINLPRDGAATLADGTLVKFADFRGTFTTGPEDPNAMGGASYQNPAAILEVTPSKGKTQTAYAFPVQSSNIPVAAQPVAGYTYQLVDFEKVSDFHILSVQRDPGATVVYVGFALLCVTLVAVFFFSHQRVWAAIEEDPSAAGSFRVTLGGNANRNENSFDDKFKNFVKNLREQF